MTTQRKDFDLNREYSVDVSNCTEEEKKLVQQAFFDVGISWKVGNKVYSHLYAWQYTNTTSSGVVTNRLMYGSTTEDCNMTAKEFLELVYEPKQKGHPHAYLMAMYAEDAKTTDKPWELWQIKIADNEWRDLTCNPSFATHLGYRRKPRTHLVNGIEIPDLRIVPKGGEWYWFPDVSTDKLATATDYWCSDVPDILRAARNLCYEYSDEGKQAAILHATAWLGITQ